MKQFIIAEKPSLAKNIKHAIQEPFTNHEGYYESESYVVSYAFGHLFALLDVEEYEKGTWVDGRPPKWELESLPFCPPQFRFSIKRDKKTKLADGGAKKQFLILSKLMNRVDIAQVIHCGDADREGEVIIRLILTFGLKTNKEILRLWLPEQTEESIRKALQGMKNDRGYDSLYNEGLARTYIDWIYGINLTRYLTLKAGCILRAGRVLTPIVKAIHDREQQRENFVEEKYWKLESREKVDGHEIPLVSRSRYPYEAQEEAKGQCQRYNAGQAVVTEIKSRESTRGAGKLYSLPKLQGVLGKKYQMTLQESLNIVQRLYEKGLVTYPRTNTEYLAENEKAKIRSLISFFQKEGVLVKFKDSRSIFDDSKIESHSALTPTDKIPSGLPEPEQKVYDTIWHRFQAVFYPEECIMEESAISILIKDEQCEEVFTIKGAVMKQAGWMQVEQSDHVDTQLPRLQKGDTVPSRFKPVEKKTQPPKKYTIASLNDFLKSPFRSAQDSEEKIYQDILKGVEIGTAATRSSIVENAIANQYISLKNNTYSIEPLGRYMVRLLEELHINMGTEKTVELSKTLKKVYNGLKIQEAVAEACESLRECFSYREKEVEKAPGAAEKIGCCPSCGEAILKNTSKKGNFYFHCSRCSFWMGGQLYGKMLEDQEVQKLMTKKTLFAKDLVSQNGKKYSATICLEMEGEKAKFSLKFPNNKRRRAQANGE